MSRTSWVRFEISLKKKDNFFGYVDVRPKPRLANVPLHEWALVVVVQNTNLVQNATSRSRTQQDG